MTPCTIFASLLPRERERRCLAGPVAIVEKGARGLAVDDPVRTVVRPAAGMKQALRQRPDSLQAGEDGVLEADRVVHDGEIAQPVHLARPAHGGVEGEAVAAPAAVEEVAAAAAEEVVVAVVSAQHVGDVVAADLAQFFLRTEGYDVHLALAVDEAEEQWLEGRPQLAIVELMISGGRGAELCRRLKQHDAGAVLAVSVLQARDEALAAGADAFLQKPLDPLEFVSTVKDLLGASALVARRVQGSA